MLPIWAWWETFKELDLVGLGSLETNNNTLNKYHHRLSHRLRDMGYNKLGLSRTWELRHKRKQLLVTSSGNSKKSWDNFKHNSSFSSNRLWMQLSKLRFPNLQMTELIKLMQVDSQANNNLMVRIVDKWQMQCQEVKDKVIYQYTRINL